MRRRFYAPAILIFVLLLSACSKEEPTLAPDELTKISVGHRDAISWGPIIIAQEEGYFADHGVDVELVRGLDTGEAIILMGQGELDIYPGFLNIGPFNAMAQGEPISLTANKGVLDPEACSYLALMVKTDLIDSGEITSIADLKGRKFPQRMDNFYGFILSTAFEGTGLTLDDIVINDIPIPARAEALTEGAAEALLSGEPWVTRLLDSGAADTILGAEEVLPNAAFGVLMFGKRLLEDNPEAGQQFMLGYQEGVRQYNEGKTERNLEILSAATELPVEFLERACWPPIAEDGLIDTGIIMDFQEWGVEQGFMDEIVPEEIFWDSRFVDFANENAPE